MPICITIPHSDPEADGISILTASDSDTTPTPRVDGSVEAHVLRDLYGFCNKTLDQLVLREDALKRASLDKKSGWLKCRGRFATWGDGLGIGDGELDRRLSTPMGSHLKDPVFILLCEIAQLVFQARDDYEGSTRAVSDRNNLTSLLERAQRVSPEVEKFRREEFGGSGTNTEATDTTYNRMKTLNEELYDILPYLEELDTSNPTLSASPTILKNESPKRKPEDPRRRSSYDSVLAEVPPPLVRKAHIETSQDNSGNRSRTRIRKGQTPGFSIPSMGEADDHNTKRPHPKKSTKSNQTEKQPPQLHHPYAYRHIAPHSSFLPPGYKYDYNTVPSPPPFLLHGDIYGHNTIPPGLVDPSHSTNINRTDDTTTNSGREPRNQQPGTATHGTTGTPLMPQRKANAKPPPTNTTSGNTATSPSQGPRASSPTVSPGKVRNADKPTAAEQVSRETLDNKRIPHIQHIDNHARVTKPLQPSSTTFIDDWIKHEKIDVQSCTHPDLLRSGGDLILSGGRGKGPNPSPKLSELLRGIAKSIVDYVLPHQSPELLTLEQLVSFFERFQVEGQGKFQTELSLFDVRPAAYPRLSRFLVCLGVEHYLIPEGRWNTPKVPALTVKGFETWMFESILRQPVLEALRLQDVLDEWKICSPDTSEEVPRRITVASLIPPAAITIKYREEYKTIEGNYLRDIEGLTRRRGSRMPEMPNRYERYEPFSSMSLEPIRPIYRKRFSELKAPWQLPDPMPVAPIMQGSANVETPKATVRISEPQKKTGEGALIPVAADLARTLSSFNSRRKLPPDSTSSTLALSTEESYAKGDFDKAATQGQLLAQAILNEKTNSEQDSYTELCCSIAEQITKLTPATAAGAKLKGRGFTVGDELMTENAESSAVQV